MQIGDLSAVRLLIVGDVMLDRYWFGDVSRISPEAPVPVVKVERSEERPGGAANVALNVKTLGAQCTLLTVVGDDEPARSLRRLLEAAGAILFAGSLVNEAATRWAPPGCLIADSKDMTLEQMSAWLIANAARCDTVVRLQTGDPALYGTLIELLLHPRDAFFNNFIIELIEFHYYEPRRGI